MQPCTLFCPATALLSAEICELPKHWYAPVAHCSSGWLTFQPKRLRASVFRRRYSGELALWLLSMASSINSSLQNMIQM